jgi:putative protease
VKDLQSGLFIPFNSLTAVKNRILSVLTGSKNNVDPIDVPFLKKQRPLETRPALGVLISSQKDLSLCSETAADIYFHLPNCFKKERLATQSFELVDLFLENRKLIPWFPSVLIGENYAAAADFLQLVKPDRIVTNNTGIAYQAGRLGIPWIAGPYLNAVNSFSLLCLKEKFNCSGAFISNEISKYQVKSIIRPADFKLYYSIYHPALLLSSRQCLFHQVIGCEKNSVDAQCFQMCNKSASITNLKNVPLLINKTKGNYHCIYHNHHYLNTDIVKDIPGTFSSFLIDLRDIATETNTQADKTGIITLFENLLNGKPDSESILKQMIHPTTAAQYIKGI